MRTVAALGLSLLACTYLPSASANVSNSWTSRVPLIEQKIEGAIQLYSKQDVPGAKKNCDDAYFGLFEEHGANMEIAIRQHISAATSSDLETRFGELRKCFVQKKSMDEIHSFANSLKKDLLTAAKDLDKNKVPLE